MVVGVVLARPVVQSVGIDAAAQEHEIEDGHVQHRLHDGDGPRRQRGVVAADHLNVRLFADWETGEETDVQVVGRHDPSLPPRAVPVVEAMLYVTVLDFMLLGGRINPDRLDDRPGEYDTDYHPSSPRSE